MHGRMAKKQVLYKFNLENGKVLLPNFKIYV